MNDAIRLLERCSVTPTPQRVAVVTSIMGARRHLTADDVFIRSRRFCHSVSRATVYNTLNQLVEKHILTTQVLLGETTVFDTNTRPHHHLVDEETGDIIDIRRESLSIGGQENLKDIAVIEFQVVIREPRKR